jgi:hypothetical protein
MKHIFKIWPNMASLASDLERPYPTVAAWKQRGRIPAQYDFDIIAAAKRRGHELTFEDMARGRLRSKTENGAAA